MSDDERQDASKPVFGFGWIETFELGRDTDNTRILLNPSSASAGLKLNLIMDLVIVHVLLNPSSASAGLKRLLN